MPERVDIDRCDATPLEGPEYRRFLDCVHCGLCTAACPTYLVTGDENNSPRGRIHLMRAVEDGRLELDDRVAGHLDLCLDCRACETACPSGVQYGRLIEPFRAAHGHKSGWLAETVLNRLFPYRERLRKSLVVARLLQRIGLDGLAKRTGLLRLAPSLLQRMHRLLPPLKASGPAIEPLRKPANGSVATVGLFLGCVGDGMFRPLHRATQRVLLAAGCTVVAPTGQGCCGAISYHGSSPRSAVQFIRDNLAAFDLDAVDAIVVNVAGCGAMLKELGHISRELVPGDQKLHEDCDRFAAKVKDVNEFLAALKPHITFLPSTQQTVVYHAACHLHHAQRVREQPIDLLECIPGVRVVIPEELEICCGAAGSYNLAQPEMAGQLGKRKADRLIAATGDNLPDAIVAANVGCSMHLAAELRERGVNVPILHPIELLDRAIHGPEAGE